LTLPDNLRTSQAVRRVMVAPMSVYQGQKISVPTVLIQKALVQSSLGRSWMVVIVARDTHMPVMTGKLRPFFQNTASARPPMSAPLVRPRRAKAAFRTKATCRLR
jgi:hypothetical protein